MNTGGGKCETFVEERVQRIFFRNMYDTEDNERLVHMSTSFYFSCSDVSEAC